MKRILSLLLTIVLALSAISFAAAENSFTLPQIGDRCSGFVVRDISRFDMLNADIVIYEHEKTGALVQLIENEDANRAFNISFHTPPLNSTGIPHVFEHSTLDGSEKYPSKALWFNAKYQTYNTFMNAATSQYMTSYPIASLSETQLLSLADLYADSCFNPMIYTDESIFREEAWRYSLDSADDDLTIEGTVYSEMSSAYSIAFAASLNANRTLFPGSISGNNHGGTPSEIPNMTWEDLKAYHETYYHPSNSLTSMYGKFEHPENFLALLDGYFSRYEKKEFVFSDDGYTPITGYVEATWDYAVPSGADTKNGSVISYGFACDDCDEETCGKLNMLSVLLNRNSSRLMQDMNQAMPYASVGCGTDFTTPVPAIFFKATNVNPEDAELFRQTVDKAMIETLAEGFDPEAVSAVAASVGLSMRLVTESSSVGVDLIPSFANYWVCYDDLFGYPKRIEMNDHYTEFAEDGTFAQLLQKYIIENDHSALCITRPVAGLKDEEDAALAERLAEIKANMSEEEIAEILKWNNAAEPDDTEVYLRQLKSVSVAELPEEARIYDISDVTGEDGIRRIIADANTDGIGEALVLLDAGGFTQEELQTFKLYTTLLGALDTADHTRAQLSALITRYLYNASLRVSVIENEDGTAAPYLRGSFIAMDEDMQPAYDLLYELFFETRFEDISTVQGEISSQRNALKRSITDNPLNMLFYRCYGNVSQASALFAHISFLDYYDFLCETEKRMETEPEAVLEELRHVQSVLRSRSNAISAFVGSKESETNHRAVADAFLNRLDDAPVTHQTYSFEPSAKSEAYITDNAMQSNVRFASYEALGLEEYRGELAVLNALLTDAYMLPMLRDQYGAYSAYAGANTQYGEILYTYSDPNIAETADVFDALPESTESILGAIDQDTLDGYILSSYSDLALSGGELSGGLSAILNLLTGVDQTDVLTYMKQLKAMTADTLASYAPVLEALTREGSFLTAGSAAQINRNADRYDAIYSPWASEE